MSRWYWTYICARNTGAKVHMCGYHSPPICVCSGVCFQARSIPGAGKPEDTRFGGHTPQPHPPTSTHPPPHWGWGLALGGLLGPPHPVDRWWCPSEPGGTV